MLLSGDFLVKLAVVRSFNNTMPEKTVPVDTQLPKQLPKEGDKNKRLMLWIIFAVAVLILIGLGAYWYFYQRPGITDQSADQQDSSDNYEKTFTCLNPYADEITSFTYHVTFTSAEEVELSDNSCGFNINGEGYSLAVDVLEEGDITTITDVEDYPEITEIDTTGLNVEYMSGDNRQKVVRAAIPALPGTYYYTSYFEEGAGKCAEWANLEDPIIACGVTSVSINDFELGVVCELDSDSDVEMVSKCDDLLGSMTITETANTSSNEQDEQAVSDVYSFEIRDRTMKAFNENLEEASLSLPKLRAENYEVDWSGGLEVDGKIYFTWELGPFGLTGEETDEQLEAIETELVNMAEDYYVYGGVWCYDTVAKEFNHLITASDEYWGNEIPYEEINITQIDDTQYLHVSFGVHDYETDQDSVYIQYLIDGDTDQVYETIPID